MAKNIFDGAQVCDRACVIDNARVSGRAFVSGDARVSGRAFVGGNARVCGDARVSGDARVFGDAVISTPQGCLVVYCQARSGIYTLTLYRNVRGNVAFTWGCRSGDDLRGLLSDPSYDALRAVPLAYLAAFELANPV
jgi:hypothetical protein